MYIFFNKNNGGKDFFFSKKKSLRAPQRRKYTKALPVLVLVYFFGGFFQGKREKIYVIMSVPKPCVITSREALKTSQAAIAIHSLAERAPGKIYSSEGENLPTHLAYLSLPLKVGGKAQSNFSTPIVYNSYTARYEPDPVNQLLGEKERNLTVSAFKKLAGIDLRPRLES